MEKRDLEGVVENSSELAEELEVKSKISEDSDRALSPQKEEDSAGAALSLTERARRAFKLGDRIAKEEDVIGEADERIKEEEEVVEGEQAREEVVEQGADGLDGDYEEEDLSDSPDFRAKAVLGDEGEEIQEGNRQLEGLVAELEAEAAANHDKYLRAVAELENYKKRVAKERSDILRYAGEHLARDLLDVADDLERAVKQGAGSSGDDLLNGIKMISNQFSSVLERHSVCAEDAVGKPFDPAKHDALATVPTTDHPAGTVIDQLRKPYFFKDKLLRAGQVVVAAAPAEEAEQESE